MCAWRFSIFASNISLSHGLFIESKPSLYSWPLLSYIFTFDVSNIILLILSRQFLLLIYWIDINSCLFFCLFLNGSFFLLCRATKKTRWYFEFCTITSLEHYLTNNGWRVQHNFSIYHPASWICLCWVAEGKPLCPQTNLDNVLF